MPFNQSNMSTHQDFVEVFHTLIGSFMAHSMREMEHFARQKGFTLPHVGLMMRLHYHKSFTISDISEHLGVTTAASSQMVQRLVEQNLIDRVEDPNDRRIKRISLAPDGQQLVNEVIALRRQWLETLSDAMPESERDQVVQALACLNQTINITETRSRTGN